MAIGKKIVVLRKKYHFTQEKLAEQVGVSRQTLSNWESDITSPDLSQASTLAKILKVSLDELADHNIEIECRDHQRNSFWDPLLGQMCYLTFVDDYFDLNFDFSKPVKVLGINEDFLKVECMNCKKTVVKLIDMDFIVAIKASFGGEE